MPFPVLYPFSREWTIIMSLRWVLTLKKTFTIHSCSHKYIVLFLYLKMYISSILFISFQAVSIHPTWHYLNYHCGVYSTTLYPQMQNHRYETLPLHTRPWPSTDFVVCRESWNQFPLDTEGFNLLLLNGCTVYHRINISHVVNSFPYKIFIYVVYIIWPLVNKYVVYIPCNRLLQVTY